MVSRVNTCDVMHTTKYFWHSVWKSHTKSCPVLVHVRGTGVWFQLHPLQQLSTTLRHIISLPFEKSTLQTVPLPEILQCGHLWKRRTKTRVSMDTGECHPIFVFTKMCQWAEIVINNVQFATISWGWYLWEKVLLERLHWSGCYFVFKFDFSGR